MRNGLRLLLTCLLAVGLAACGEATDPDERVAALEAELARRTEELQAARERFDRQVTEFAASVQERHGREIRTLETRLAEEREASARTIRSLQWQLDSARAAAEPGAGEALPPEPEPPPAEFAPPQPRVVTRATAVEAMPFPVMISDVAGAREVIGFHPSIRVVETDEEYRDSFGVTRRRTRPETYEVPEYGYRVSATLRNPGAGPVTVHLRCGQVEEAITLAGGETRAVSLDASRGAPLVVRVDGQTVFHPVAYP